VIPIHLPPLRERREDIPLLARVFLERYRVSMGKSVESIQREAMRLLEAYDWPGNVRELENTIERAVVLESGRQITVDGLPERVQRYHQEGGTARRTSDNVTPLIPETGIDFEALLRETERAYLMAALEHSSGRVRAAELLKMTYRSFRHYAKKHDV
jgi:two-component system, NtrC family, response regulator PilR